MSLSDYALNLLLVALVLRQIRGKRLTVVSLAWPVGIVVIAAVEYLHGVPAAGNDLELVGAGVLVGGTLGGLCGLFTRIHRLPDRALVAKATGLAAALWVLGTGARMAFALYAQNGGGPAIGRFSVAHDITGARAWTAALVLMALAEVLGRTAILGARMVHAAPTCTLPVDR
jgi:hypothetical protein